MSDLKTTERFSNRVDDYVRYRPDYPPALLDWLHKTHGVTTSWQVADIGAGTGISSKMFLDAGHRVVAVEPNASMRGAAERWLADYPGFSTTERLRLCSPIAYRVAPKSRIFTPPVSST